MVTQAQSVTPSNYAAIIQAIHDIAHTQAGITFRGSKIGETPTPADIAAGTPYLAVRRGKLVGFADGGLLRGGADAVERGVQHIEPVWDFEVWAFAPYQNDTTAVATYATVAVWLINLAFAFIQFWNLNDTCQVGNPHSWELLQLSERVSGGIGGRQFYACKLTIRAYEFLPIQY